MVGEGKQEGGTQIRRLIGRCGRVGMMGEVDEMEDARRIIGLAFGYVG